MRLARHGISAELPAGWDARIYRRAESEPGGTTHGVLHAASFPLPAERGDYGSGAVERMGEEDVFVALVEFHPDAAGTALFAHSAMPRALTADVFSPGKLQHAVFGQGGTQVFFSAAGRAYCLYVVLGSYAQRALLLPRVNRLLAGIQLDSLATLTGLEPAQTAPGETRPAG